MVAVPLQGYQDQPGRYQYAKIPALPRVLCRVKKARENDGRSQLLLPQARGVLCQGLKLSLDALRLKFRGIKALLNGTLPVGEKSGWGKNKQG